MPLEAPGGGLYHVEYATTGHGGLYDVADVSGLWAVSWCCLLYTSDAADE